ncbi:MAG: hypothetical protein ACRD07_19305 [Acidimicrobiales bacterium]
MAGLTIDDLVARANPVELAEAERRRTAAQRQAAAEREARRRYRSLCEELNEIGKPRPSIDPYARRP